MAADTSRGQPGMSRDKTDYSSLDVGFEFPPTKFVITEDWYSRYADAVGEDIGLCRRTGLVSPMSVLALTMAEMSRKASLPEGSIHVSQTFEFYQALHLNDVVTATAGVTQRLRSRRVDLLTISFRLYNQNNEQVASAETEFILGHNHGS